jgi:hypothetical protein
VSDEPLVTNASDEKQVKEAGKRRKVKDAEEITDLREVLKTPAGRRVLWRVLELCRAEQISFSTNALQMAFNEGHRNVGVQVKLAIVSADPALWTAMQEEAAG